MTANAGKGADGKPGQRSTGSDAKSGRTRKKTSAAKPPSDEVTVRTDAKDDTNGSASDEAEKTVIDKAKKKSNEDTVRDVPPADPEPDNDATVVDALPSLSSSSSSSEDASNRTATFGLPKDADSDRSKKDGSGASKRAIEPASRDDAAKKPQESGESLPTSGRGAGMGSSTSGYGGGTGAGTPSYAPSGSLSASAMPGGGPGDGSGPAAIEAPSSRAAKLTGALRKADKAGGRKAPRKAHLQVARFEPWSVMKFSFIMSLVCFLVLFVAVAVLYVILSWLGVFDALSNTIRDLTSNDQGKSGGLNPASWFSAARILGYTALIGTLNVLLITALATVWSVIYNMAADLVGGVEVTLKEADQ
ncbi:DUF3566 domain-containing protein [Actinoallomurus sp. NBC_01490]|uniref:DUF3566 domain-containing protein n=1 Tax=Actinoallomurus sp. NBC_01490 TaxID=2903557 RepID=UPI002E306596|nr:DUF3566 domain-containing protein [Actinoallomurus sp. NBC_01490]